MARILFSNLDRFECKAYATFRDIKVEVEANDTVCIGIENPRTMNTEPIEKALLSLGLDVSSASKVLTALYDETFLSLLREQLL